MNVHSHRRTKPTARLLAAALADLDTPLVLNWGRTRGPEADYLNPLDAVELASNKPEALAAMRDRKVPTPWFTTDRATARGVAAAGVPLVGRPDHHRAGSDFVVCRSGRDVADDTTSTHWMVLVDVAHEYRVHVIGGKVVKTSEKRDGDGLVRSASKGWRFRTPTTPFEERKPVRRAARRAVRALGLDFGAADVLVDPSGRVYVVEVNTAPSLTSSTATTLTHYVEAIAALVAERQDTECPTP